MNTKVRIQLSVMMFLEYFIWGAWYVTMGPYLLGTLNFSGQQNGLAYSSTAFAAMISPFFVGMIADRFFATEKVLALLHLLGGLSLFAASQAKTFEAFFPLLMAHTLCYMPTLALTNSISFHQMKDAGKEFPLIRVLGTISWIVAGLTVNSLGSKAITTPLPFVIAAGVSVLMGLYCLTLPHTPPTRVGEKVTVRDVLGLDALALLKERSFAVFVIGAFLFCIPLTFYFSFVPAYLSDLLITNIPGKMTMGQMSEIFFMLVMPFFFVRLGVKWMLLVGMCAWGLRYILMAFGDNLAVATAGMRADQLVGLISLAGMLYLGIILHGICYDFFFVTAYIYVDKKAPETIRAKAQGFIAFVMLGAGMFVGANLSGIVAERYSFPNVEPTRFQAIADPANWAAGNFAKWETTGQIHFGKINAILQEAAPSPGASQASAAATKQSAARIEVFNRVGDKFQPSGQEVTQPLSALSKPLRLWKSIWLIPAMGSFVIMVLFALLFQYKEETKPVK
jgi:nucleoside transporter